MKKLTVKQELQVSREIISKILYDVCKNIGDEQVAEIYADFLQNRLFDIDKDIRSEKNFIKENPPQSTYASAAKDARKQLRHLKKTRGEILKLIRLWNLFVKQQDKITKMWC